MPSDACPHRSHPQLPPTLPLPPASLPCLQRLIDKLDGDLEYALRTDGKMAPGDCENYEEVGQTCHGGLGLG